MLFLFKYCELSASPADSVCQKCGRKMHVHGNYPTCLRHLNFGGKLSCVCFEKSRYYCPACRHSQMQGIPFKAEYLTWVLKEAPKRSCSDPDWAQTLIPQNAPPECR